MTEKIVKNPKVEVLTDDERAVMRVFARGPTQCIHALHHATGLPFVVLLEVTAKLQRRGKIYKKVDQVLTKHDKQYVLREASAALTADQFMEDRLSPLIGLNERDMQGRVHMLRRMRRLLIQEWHPVLDILIADYERDLLRVKLLREPPEDGDDGMDVLDRDFEKE